MVRVGAAIKMEAEPIIDSFGAYTYDRTCKIGPFPQDWWLDTAFRVQGQTSIESVTSLRSGRS